MFKKTCVQRISAIVTAIGMVVALTSTSYNMAKASEIEVNKVSDDSALVDYETNANNLVDDYDEDSELCQKLELDYDNSTTDLSEEREKELNEIGVFDSDIESWDDETVEKLDDAYSYSMSVMYYGENPEDGTLEELSQKETDEVIQDVYGDELEKAAEDGNILEQALENTVFGAVKAKARSNSKTTISASGKVKQIISFIQERKGASILVTYSCIWLEEPKCKKTDILAVKLDHAECDTSTFEKYRTWQWIDNTRSTYQTYVEKPSKNYCDASPYGMAAKYDFYTKNSVFTRNHTFVLKFRCEPKANKIYATGRYYHCKSAFNLSLSGGVDVNVNAKGINLSPHISGSVSSDAVYSQISNNPVCYFFPK